MNPSQLTPEQYKLMITLVIWVSMAIGFCSMSWALFELSSRTEKGAYIVNRWFNSMMGPDL